MFDVREKTKFLNFVKNLKGGQFSHRLVRSLSKINPCRCDDLFCLCKFYPLALLLLSFVSPLINCICAFVYWDNLSLKIVSTISVACFLISGAGVLGSGMFGCLYHPCNWFFIMLFSDLTILLTDIYTIGLFIYLFRIKEIEHFKFVFLYGIICFPNFVLVCLFTSHHYNTYNHLSNMFKLFRKLELDDEENNDVDEENNDVDEENNDVDEDSVLGENNVYDSRNIKYNKQY